MLMKMPDLFMKIIKIDVVTIPYNRFCGVEHIKIYLFTKRKKRNGLISEACIDYLREGEYWHY
jgi:hypothetical protein